MKYGVLGIVVVCVAVAGSAWGNLLANPGFETGDLTGWELENPGGTLSVQDASWRPDISLTPHSGNYFCVKPDDDAGGLTWLRQNIEAPDGPGIYAFNWSYWAWAYNSTSFGECVAACWFRDEETLFLGEPQQTWVYHEGSSIGPVGVPPAPSPSTTLSPTWILRSDVSPWWEYGEGFTAIDDIVVTARLIPEPTTMAMLGFGLLGLGCRRIRARD